MKRKYVRILVSLVIMLLIVIGFYTYRKFLPNIRKSDVITVNSYSELEKAVESGKGGWLC